MDLGEIECESMDWIRVAKKRDQDREVFKWWLTFIFQRWKIFIS